VLEDRAGGDVQFLQATWTSSWRPLASVRNWLDRHNLSAERATEVRGCSTGKSAEASVAVSDVYKTIQAFMGGQFINYFNDFGRTCRCTWSGSALPVETGERGQFLCAQQQGGDGAAFGAG